MPGASRILGDPALPLQAGLTTPVWDPAAGEFGGGFNRILQVLEQLAVSYGQPGVDGSGVGQARSDPVPDDDLLGRPRGASPSLGAMEPEDPNLLFRNGFES